MVRVQHPGQGYIYSKDHPRARKRPWIARLTKGGELKFRTGRCHEKRVDAKIFWDKMWKYAGQVKETGAAWFMVKMLVLYEHFAPEHRPPCIKEWLAVMTSNIVFERLRGIERGTDKPIKPPAFPLICEQRCHKGKCWQECR